MQTQLPFDFPLGITFDSESNRVYVRAGTKSFALSLFTQEFGDIDELHLQGKIKNAIALESGYGGDADYQLIVEFAAGSFGSKS